MTDHQAVIDCDGSTIFYNCSCGYIAMLKHPAKVAEILAVHENHLFVSRRMSHHRAGQDDGPRDWRLG